MMRHRRFAFAFPILAVLALAACSDDTGTGPEEEDVAPATDFSDPAEAVMALGTAWSAMDYSSVEAMLAEDFEFYPPSSDVDDFPWITDDSWDRTTELGVAANMFAAEPLPGGQAPPVETITFEQTVRSVRILSPGTHEVVTSAEITILFNSTDGFRAVAALVHLLETDDRGFLRIRETRERELLLTPPDPRVDTSSWGSIKALYRDRSGPEPGLR